MITNNLDLIDSRTAAARLKELTEEREELHEILAQAQEDLEESAEIGGPDEVISTMRAQIEDNKERLAGWEEDWGEELAALKSLEEQASRLSWNNGGTLIRDDHFEDYARELAESMYAELRAGEWPFNHIDWEGAAEALKADYRQVDFDGVTYWVRL